LLIVQQIKKPRAYFPVSAYALLLLHCLDAAFSLQALCWLKPFIHFSERVVTVLVLLNSWHFLYVCGKSF